MNFEQIVTQARQSLSDLGPFAITFAGQSLSWVDPLADTLAAGCDGPLREALAQSDETLASLADDLAGQLPNGFAPLEWAAASRTETTFTGDTLNPAVSVPGILLAQLGVIQQLAVQGIQTCDALGAIGHSQGVLAAAAVEAPDKIADIITLARLIGVACARGTRAAGFGSRPMLAVSGITVDKLEGLIKPTSVIGLKNSRTSAVVIGPESDLVALEAALDAFGSVNGREAGGTATEINHERLNVTGAFHHPALKDAADWAINHAAHLGMDTEWAAAITNKILVDSIDWVAEVRSLIDAGAATILDLGPQNGVATLTRRNAEGHGVAVISAATAAGQATLFEAGRTIERPQPWSDFAPRLVQSSASEELPRVHTAFTRLTGRSPIILGGMTPTTVDPAIVAAAANAGFWAELAGGGQVTPEIFERNVARLHELLDDGRSAQFNTMFLDPYLWGMHISQRRLVPRAVAAGRPIDGVTISAGIPETDEAVKIVADLRAAGIPYIAFKPGTIAQIKSVIAIADALDQEGTEYPIIMQIEGGRAGGHHSWENLDELLLATYAEIRRRDIVLAVGGGIGAAEQARDYLMGTWSKQYDVAPMPVDAIIIGTAAMAAKESTASQGVKKLLVETTGTNEWVEAGSATAGMASGRSQLGADIHEIDNSAARAGRLLDDVAGDAEAVAARRTEIIAAINRTAKPYFGNVELMTYRGLLERYLELCAPGDEFIDPTWATRFLFLIDHIEARLSSVDSGEVTSVLTEELATKEPSAAIARLAEVYPLDAHLHPADVAFFINDACRTPGKPVPFVPVIDTDVRRWWRSDSLWQAHDGRYDADGVCIIPGPQAVAGITKADEPVADILMRFETLTAQALAESGQNIEPVDGVLDQLLSAPVVWWAGRQVKNPVLQLGAASEWISTDAHGCHMEHSGTGAEIATEFSSELTEVGLAVVTAQSNEAVLTVPLANSAPEDKDLRLHFRIANYGDSTHYGAVPIISADDAADSMRALTAIAAGGELVPVTNDVAQCTSMWNPIDAADYDAVTDMGTGVAAHTAPDVLVGHAWPAIFSAVAEARTADGVEVVEGMLSLVHLEHHIRMVSELPKEATELVITAHVDEVSDTDLGRIVVVRAEIRDTAADANAAADSAGAAADDFDSSLIATLSERFAIRGRNGNATAQTNTVPFPTEEDTPRSHRGTLTVTAPETMVPFAVVTGDRNPIHVDKRAAQLAGLPGVIVHGMWLSAMAEHAAVAAANAAQGDRVIEFTATMMSPVLPGQKVRYVVERRGFDTRPGAGEVREITATVGGELVLTATAVIAAPTTVYAFPGQGIQARGMGLDARTRSAAARRVWDAADEMTRTKLGFSVLAIVRDNPTEIVVDGTRYFHPEGVLNLTQFTQVSMATLGLAQAAELREAGLLDENAYFAGHSVGEYNALAAFAGALEPEAVIEVVYRRGLTMHSLVPRDEQGRSNYGLAALRPEAIGVAEDEVVEFVAGIAQSTGEFLEVVNLNLAGKQYAVAGTVAGLAALNEEALRRRPDGKGYVRIPGIDVPFHSAVLRDGVDSFRAHLDRLLPAEIDPSRLVGRYIPNLTATCFELTEAFVRDIAAVVDSPIIAEILADFDAAVANPAQLARTLLVELLAWQFCSPVRWIETQYLLFDALSVTRFIEVGVATAPTLANLAARTTMLPRHSHRDIGVLNVERDSDTVFMRDEVLPEPEELEEEASAANEGTESAATKTLPVAPERTPEIPDAPAPATAPALGAAGASVERPADITVTPDEALEVLICQWTKVRPDQLGAADSIETLVDGVSSRRNQLLLDLGVEFGLGSIEGAADAELPDLKSKINGLARGYSAFGPVLSEAIADGLRRVTGPAGARPNAIADRVRDTWELGDGWATAVGAEIMLGSREGASLRGGDLAHLTPAAPTSAAELNDLIDAAVVAVGVARGITVAKPAKGSVAGGVVDSAALDAFAEQVTGSTGVLAVAARTILEQLGHELTGSIDFDADDADETLVDLVTAELGSDWPKLVTPFFKAEKAVLLDDRWASSREDLARMWAASSADLDSVRPTSIDPAAAAQAQWWARRAEAAHRTSLAVAYRTLASQAQQEVAADFEFAEDIAVVTGGSPNSIAAALIGELLAGGATVVATTSRLDHARLNFYKKLFRSHARGTAALWVVPANLSSYQDIDGLIKWVGEEQTATVGADTVVTKPALAPTLLFPFAAPRVSGSLADAGTAAETQMRLLLWSVERLISGLGNLGGETNLAHRLHVVLPGSPNRGRFGGDGAYGEAKAALDAVVTRWGAESVWASRTTLAHAHIGWVRGTGLMGGNDPLVNAVEAKGVRTFSTEEMAARLIDLARADARRNALHAPLVADLTGGLGEADLDLSRLAAEAADATNAAAAGTAGETASASGASESALRTVAALPNLRTPIAQTKPKFDGVTVAPEDMVVIVGAGELSPYGSSRTRFEAEVGEISAAGIVELAWSMGLISYDNGWLDADGQPLKETEIADRYRDEVLGKVGVRRYGDDGDLVDNTMTELTTVYLDRNLSFPVRDRAAAATFVKSDPEHTSARADEETGEWIVTRAAGTPVQVPRRMAMSRYVGGQIPEGFDPARYGIPADMMDNLDRVSLWNIVCTVDAFLASGFDPAELLAAVHPSRVSSTQGTGIGAMESLRSLYIDGLLSLPRANDVLQEALPNVIAAHVMQAYVGGYGQMIHPVAACATAAVSVEEGADKIALGKADFVVAGGFDDLSTEGITGFGDMAATADSATMDGKGIERKFFSRPNDRRRGGFVESQGGGTVLLARGSLARDMGLPVLGVVAYAQSFADGAHTSIPAPGLGALSSARGGANSRLATSLAAHGVSANEVAVLSKHDTSTNANDPNESELHERIADALGRDEANPLFVVSQKSLTGHAKGGAAAFQMIGLTQVLRSGIIPANRALDCVDPKLAKYERLVWATSPIKFGERLPLKAGFVTSLGFGHVSALVAIVHPEAFYQAVVSHNGQEAADTWRTSATRREAVGLRRIDDAIYGGAALYERPEARRLGNGGSFGSPEALEKAVLLADDARLVDGVLTVTESADKA